MSDEGVCVFCGKVPVNKWTINAPVEVMIVDLCAEHERPLYEFMDAASEAGPDSVKKVRRRRTGAKRDSRKEPAPRLLQPLDDWKPPVS